MRLYIFGATGDLVKRKILPALITLNKKGLEIVALGRKDYTNETYREFICTDDCFENFEIRPIYKQVHFGEAIDLGETKETLSKKETNFFYLALPPDQLEKAFTFFGALKREGFPLSICVEKPFGESLKDATRLFGIIKKEDLEKEIFLSSHYLFKDEVLALQSTDFKKLKLVLLETVGLERRINYYDGVGALKDIVQSHFLNIAFKLLPNRVEEFKQFQVLRFERAQYKGYEAELGKPSKTETFISLLLKGASREFEFITGKKFNKKVSYIEIDGARTMFISNHNAYEKLFEDFFAGRRDNFPTLDQTLLAWEITEKIESKNPPLISYEADRDVSEIL